MHDDEWRDDKGIPVYPPPFEMESKRCAVCEAIEDHKKDIADNEIDPRGLHIRMNKTDPLDYIEVP